MRARLAVGIALIAVAAGCGGDGGESLTVYSGRTENLIGPLLEDFTEETGIDVEVRYGQSADLALLISQEGDRSPADVFISQSPGAVGFLAGEVLLDSIDPAVLELVEPEFRNGDGRWVGLSGRVRVAVYNPSLVAAEEIPASVFDLTGPAFTGDVGIAPANGSFQDFVTAMRELSGDEATQMWLEGLAANDAQTYTNNTAIVEAVARGEVPIGLVNHYYSLRARAEDPAIAAENFYFPSGDIGSLLIATAAGVLVGSDDAESADRLIEFLLSPASQSFFSTETLEYPLAAGVEPSPELPALSALDVATYDFDDLAGGLERTKELIDASGLESP